MIGPAVAGHPYVEASRTHDRLGLAAVLRPVDLHGEGHPALLRELFERHPRGYRRGFELRGDGLHHPGFGRIGVAAVGLVGEPAAVGVGLDVEIPSRESERQRGIAALFDLPARRLARFPDLVAFPVGGFHQFVGRVLLDDDGVLHGEELFGRELHDAPVGSCHQRPVGHAVPLGEDRRYLGAQLRGNPDRKGVAPRRALRTDALAVVVDGFHPLGIGVGLVRERREVGRRGVAPGEFRSPFGLARGIAFERVVVASEREAVGGFARVHAGMVAAEGFGFADAHGDPLAVDHLTHPRRIGLDVHPFGQRFVAFFLSRRRHGGQQQHDCIQSVHLSGVHIPVRRFWHPRAPRSGACRPRGPFPERWRSSLGTALRPGR